MQENIGDNFCDPVLGWVLDLWPKAQILSSWILSKFKTLVLWKNQLWEWKDNHRLWENICKILDPDYIKYLDPEETKKKKQNFEDSTAKKKP